MRDGEGSASPRRPLDFDEPVDWHEGYLVGSAKSESELDTVQFPGSNEVDGAIDGFEIAGFCGVAGPFVRSLEVKPGGHVPQKRFHTDPFRICGPIYTV